MSQDDVFDISVGERNDAICRFHMKFLETMCEFWPYARARERAMKNFPPDIETLRRCDKELEPIVAEAKRWLNEVIYLRLCYSRGYEGLTAIDKYGRDTKRKPREDFKDHEDELCKNDIAHWVNHYVWTFDPRLPSYGLPANIPMIMWPKQEEFVKTVDQCWRYGLHLVAPKSRAYGLTYLAACFSVHHWLYVPGFSVGMNSRKEELVDDGSEPRSLFWKVRHIIYHLPYRMRPSTFEKRNGPNDNRKIIHNPDNLSTIGGEVGEAIGVGDRKSIYFCDEKALQQNGAALDTGLSQTTNCQVDISTLRGANHFWQKVVSKRVRVFWAWWYHDPAKNPAWRTGKHPGPGNVWREWQDDRHDPVINAQEVDIDPQASVEDAFIPAEWVRAAVDFDLPTEGVKQGGFDVAAGGKNKSIYVSRIGPVTMLPKVISFDTPNEAAVRAVKYGEEDTVDGFVYDQDGVGEGIIGTFKVLDYPINFPMVGVHGNSPAPDLYIYEDGKRASEKFGNLRAYNWWNLRQKFRKTYEHRKGIRSYPVDELISIPDRQELITQLSQPKMLWQGHGSKIYVESKRDMKRRGVESPDEADATVNAHAEIDPSERVVSKLDYRDKGNIAEFEVDYESAVGDQYVSLYQTQDMKVHALACWWRSSASNPLLRVYWEFEEHNPDIARFCNEIQETMCAPIKPIKKWLCNDEMYKEAKKGKLAPFLLFRRQAKITLHRNFMNDMRGSIMLLNTMLDKRILEIHVGCEKLWLQLTHWRMRRGAPEDNMGLSLALCQMVTWLKTSKKIDPVVMKPSWRPRNPFRGAEGHFGRTMKPEENADMPSYFKKAKEYAGH